MVNRRRIWGRVALVLSVTAGLALVGCGDADYEGDSAQAGYIGEVREDLTQSCGADRYDGVQGADVSKYQGNFNWAGAGVTFGFARISDGTQYIDSYFESNWSKMKAAGVLRGAYQYFRPGQSATAQADMVVAKVGKLGAGDLPCVIDVESTDGQSPSTVVKKVQTWLDIVEKGTGKRPIIYTGPYFWQDKVGSTAFGKYPLWIAHYGTTCPKIPDGWSKWTFWQYCDGQTQYCKNGKGWDRNVFNGSKAELVSFAGKSAGPVHGASFVEQSFPLAATALEMTAGETLTASITLKNSGTAPWDSKTRLATTEPRDRESVFADESWINPGRPAAVEGTVAPGESYKFTFTLRAPSEPGTYDEYFGVVQEGVTWFSAEGELGPPDNQLQAQIKVVAGAVTGTGGGDGEGAAGGEGGEGGEGGTGGRRSTGARPDVDEGDAEGGCGCRVPRAPRPARGQAALLLLGLTWAIRRRSRS